VHTNDAGEALLYGLSGLAPAFGFLWLAHSDGQFGFLLFDLVDQQAQVLHGPGIATVSRDISHTPNQVGHEEFGVSHLLPPDVTCRTSPRHGNRFQFTLQKLIARLSVALPSIIAARLSHSDQDRLLKIAASSNQFSRPDGTPDFRLGRW
jgi:hypothetical protein